MQPLESSVSNRTGKVPSYLIGKGKSKYKVLFDKDPKPFYGQTEVAPSSFINPKDDPLNKVKDATYEGADPNLVDGLSNNSTDNVIPDSENIESDTPASELSPITGIDQLWSMYKTELVVTAANLGIDTQGMLKADLIKSISDKLKLK